jgi:CelD/BcsL family acetyltransferase involved in cellulose biosynthesis
MDILCRPELEAETIRMVSEFLAGSSNSWDICDFQELRQSSPMLNIKLGEEFEIKTTHSGVCPVTVLPESLDKYLHSLPVSFRKNIIRARRQLSDLGELSLEVAKEENLDEYMAWLFRLHNASWHKRNMPGLLAESALQDFHRETAKELFQNKIMRLYVLKHNGKVISAVYSLIKDSRLYYYIGGFDPVFSKFSPGSVILLEIIKNAISEGIRKFDFLRGSEDYKYKWNAEDRSNFRMFIKKKDH